VLIIPAIDLKDGRCVRLKQGDMSTATVFSDDPVAMAQHWAAQGARRLHIVDLNGAVAGRPKNEKVIREMIAAVGEQVPIQVGGGIRDLDTIESYLDAGVTYIVVGTAAVKNPGFLSDACYAFPGHIIAGLDAKDGKVAGMKLTDSSGDVALDRAAWGGITASNPFPPLPSDFGGQYLALRFRFYYNPDKSELE